MATMAGSYPSFIPNVLDFEPEFIFRIVNASRRNRVSTCYALQSNKKTSYEHDPEGVYEMGS
jgi:hypothetical protein